MDGGIDSWGFSGVSV